MKIVLVSGLIAALSMFSGCVRLESAPSKPHSVKYQVSYGTPMADGYITLNNGVADLTYANKGGGTNQESKVQLPWSKSFIADRGSHLYISAQDNTGLTIGVVIVEIYVDDVLFKISSSKGAYVIATASGTL
jgi:hypothetical protein